MQMIKGISVTLHVKDTLHGVTDDFGKVTYPETTVAVDDVLVSPASDDDVASTLALYGKRAAYVLAIPKGDTHDWEDTTVEFFGRTWRTIGFSVIGIDDLIPLRWNRKVKVEAYG